MSFRPSNGRMNNDQYNTYWDMGTEMVDNRSIPTNASIESPLRGIRKKHKEVTESNAPITEKIVVSAEYFYLTQKENAKKVIEFIKEKYEDVSPILNQKINDAVTAVSEYQIPGNIKEGVSNSVVSLHEAVDRLNVSENLRSTLTNFNVPPNIQDILMCSHAPDFFKKESLNELIVEENFQNSFTNSQYEDEYLYSNEPVLRNTIIESNHSINDYQKKKSGNISLIDFDDQNNNKPIQLPTEAFINRKSSNFALDSSITLPRNISSSYDGYGNIKIEGRKIFLEKRSSNGIGVIRFLPRNYSSINMNIKLTSPSSSVGVFIGITAQNENINISKLYDNIRMKRIQGYFVSLEDEILLGEDGTVSQLAKKRLNLMQESVVGIKVENRVMSVYLNGSEFAICSFQQGVALPDQYWIPTIIIMDSVTIPPARVTLMD